MIMATSNITSGRLSPNKVKKFGAKNMKELQYPNGMKVMVSYKTPVVLFDGKEYFTCTEKFSRTTSKQINFYLREETKNGPYVAFSTKQIPVKELHDKIYNNLLTMHVTW